MVVEVPAVSAHGVAMSLVRFATSGACVSAWRPARRVALQSRPVVTLALRGCMATGQLLREGGALKGLCVVHFSTRGACGNPAALHVGRGAQRVGRKYLKNISVARQGT